MINVKVSIADNRIRNIYRYIRTSESKSSVTLIKCAAASSKRPENSVVYHSVARWTKYDLTVSSDLLFTGGKSCTRECIEST